MPPGYNVAATGSSSSSSSGGGGGGSGSSSWAARHLGEDGGRHLLGDQVLG
jgi:hypothetical protein